MANKVDYDKLQDALEYIKSVCEDSGNNCRECPLGCGDGFCRVTAVNPDEWNIRHPETDVFRAIE